MHLRAAVAVGCVASAAAFSTAPAVLSSRQQVLYRWASEALAARGIVSQSGN